MPTRATAPLMLIITLLTGIVLCTPVLAQTRKPRPIHPDQGYSDLRFLPNARSGVDEKSPMSIAVEDLGIVAFTIGSIKPSNPSRSSVTTLAEVLTRFIDSFPTGLVYIGNEVRSTARRSAYIQDIAYSDVASRIDINGQALLLPRDHGFTIGVQQDETRKRLGFLRSLNHARALLNTPLPGKTGSQPQDSSVPEDTTNKGNGTEQDKTVLDFIYSYINETNRYFDPRARSQSLKQLIDNDFDIRLTPNDYQSIDLSSVLNRVMIDNHGFLDVLQEATSKLIDTYNDLKNTARVSISANYRRLTYGEDWSLGISVSQRLFKLAPADIHTGRPDLYGAMSLQYQAGNYPHDQTGNFPGDLTAQRQHLSGIRPGLAIYYQDHIPYIENTGTPNEPKYDNHRWSKQLGAELVFPNALVPHAAYDAFFRYRDLSSGSETILSVGKDAYDHVFVNIGFGYSYPKVHSRRQNQDSDDLQNKMPCKTSLDATDDWTTSGSPIPPHL